MAIYKSIRAMMKGLDTPIEIQRNVERLVKENALCTRLAVMRTVAKLSQQQMAKELSVTQGAISRLESGGDASLTIKQVQEYSRVCGKKIRLTISKTVELHR